MSAHLTSGQRMASLKPGTVCACAGDKIRVAGAEVSAGGAQTEALEAAKTTFLRITYNGTHRHVPPPNFWP